MKILHVTPSYYPATYYGGPIFSTYGMCNALAAFSDLDLRVLSCDMAGPSLSDRLRIDKEPLRYTSGYDVFFARRRMLPDVAPGLITRLWQLGAWADVIWLTGTYSFPTLPTLIASRLLGKPLVWSPRGALQASHQWAGAKRPTAKRAFERLCRALKPQRAVLHVTAEIEKEASLARMPEFDVEIINNAVESPIELPARTWQPGGVLRLMSISRVDPKKGLDNLLRALALLNNPTTLAIYGTGDPKYVGSLIALRDELGLHTRVTFFGHVVGDQKTAAFANADLLVLPTHSENFGMVVAEALAHAVPAIVSHGAPWPELESHGCGLWVDRSPQSLAAAIEKLRCGNLELMGERGRIWMMNDFSWTSRALDMRALFKKLMIPIEAGPEV